MIKTGKKFSKPEMSRVINGDISLPEAEADPEKIRLDVLMTEIFRSYNRSTLQKFIELGFVTVDGELAKKPNQKFERNVRIDLKIPKVMKNADIEPIIIYEDNDVVVVNKPVGMLSEPRGGYCPEKTLEDYGLPAHRLDRDTSGVVILAKTPEVLDFLKKQFRARTVHKTYVAVVTGVMKLDKARIDLPLIRNLKRPTTFLVDPNGKPAETFYEVVKANNHYSMLKLRPITGRTHQLRVHLKYLGHPILGDRVYGEKLPEDLPERLYLHAERLEIELPNGVKKTFTAPVPREFYHVF